MAAKILQDYPNMLFDANEIFKDYVSNLNVLTEARGLVYNVKMNNGRMPNELSGLHRGFDPEQYSVPQTVQVYQAPTQKRSSRKNS